MGWPAEVKDALEVSKCNWLIRVTAASADSGKPITKPLAAPEPDYATPGARTRYSFEQIVPLLNTPARVSFFVKNNIELRPESINEYAPARLIFERGYDDGDGHAILQAYLLERNGWDAFMIGLGIDGPGGRNACGVVLPDGKIQILDSRGMKVGVFSSLDDVAHYYMQNGWVGGSLRTIKASLIVEVLIGDSVLALPWAIHTVA